MKNNQFFIIVLSLSLAIVSIAISFYNMKPFYTTEFNYIGIMATFIGILVAILVGYQIYNSIGLNEKLSRIDKIETNLNKQKKINEQSYYREEGILQLTQGLVMWLTSKNISGVYNNDYLVSAFIAFNSAVGYFSNSDKDKIPVALSNMEYVLNQINNTTISKEQKETLDSFKKNIEEQDSYCLFKVQYEKLITSFNDKVKLKND